jgi:hypothetical protein
MKRKTFIIEYFQLILLSISSAIPQPIVVYKSICAFLSASATSYQQSGLVCKKAAGMHLRAASDRKKPAMPINT